MFALKYKEKKTIYKLSDKILYKRIFYHNVYVFIYKLQFM